MDVDDRANGSGDESRPGPSTLDDPAFTRAPMDGKTASEHYKKLTPREHVIARPDSYIGSVETITQSMWVYDSDAKRMVFREVSYVPGFLKIVDEIIVNAADNKINDPNMDTIKVNINAKEGTISVYNNGRGIPIEMHEKEKIMIPEMIFGHLLTSGNYDDTIKKLTGGRNGYGAKLANIYSTEFTLETADKNTAQKYKQTWTKNMSVCGKAKITKNSKGEEFTRVSFTPDFERFKMRGMDADALALLKKRVYDLAGTVKDIKVYLNDERLKIKNFKQYVEMYLSSAAAEAAGASGGAAQAKPSVIYEQLGPRWEIAFAVSDGSFQQVSFANSIATTKGGTHVEYIANQITKHLISTIQRKNKGATVKPAQIKNHMWIFVNALIENPSFDSQTKETLTKTAGGFGTKPTISEDFMKKVMKTSLVENVLNWAKFKADQQIKKTDGAKRSRLLGITKLADANNAGTREASKCTLILTEGDSAKALAVAGLGVVGRNNFGVFPLRGKMLNVREAKHDQIMKNEEIQNVKKILGLQHNKEYKDIASLRYGRLMIMTDQDHDGSHIKGLLINFLDHFYPSLLKVPEFLVEFVTPIVRVTKGKQRIDFFTLPEFEKWQAETPDSHKWSSKYYKGLGTSKDSDARDYFSNMGKHMIPFATTQEGDRELIELAFSKKKADERKEWLRQFRPGTYLDHNVDEIPYSDFINKELILFSMADNIRSIPSVADGLKPGQRKVIWGCFKRKLKKEIKVAQLVGYISEHAAYHHGEQSLTMTIVNLAQDFVGSNNMNLLLPNGQYGTRDQGGKDHASARYIYTEPAPISRLVFHQSDDALLNEQKEDGQVIEPEFYVPILPLVLVNGAEGIGTGWSTTVPSYNPVDIVDNLKRLMKGEELVPMNPWWRGFNGTIKKTGDNKFEVTGVVKKLNDTTVEITELPIHKWTQAFKAELESMCGEKGDGAVKDYKEHHDNRNVHFVVNMNAKELEKAEAQGLEEYFKLTSKISTSNMICFDFEGKIKKYNTPEEILEDFFPVRLGLYQKRKDYLANELQLEHEKLSNQARFVQMIVKKELVVSGRKKVDIVADLRKKNFRPFPKVAKAKAAGETEDALEDTEAEEQETGTTTDFDYLLGMPIYNLTHEKIEKLLEQARQKETELMTLLELTPSQIWNTDLDNFLALWEKTCKEWDESAIKDSSGKTVKRKQATLKTRKSLTGPFGKRRKDDDDDSEDEFMPSKAAAKAVAKKPDPIERKVSRTKAIIKNESDDDDDLFVAPGPSKPTARKAAETMRKVSRSKPVTKVVSDDSDDDDDKLTVTKASTKDESDYELPKPPSKRKALAKADDLEDELALTTEKGKGKAKVAPKRKSLTADEGSDDDDLASSKPPKKKAQVSLRAFLGKDDGESKAKPPTPSKVAGMKPKPKAAPAKKPVISDEDSDTEVIPAAKSKPKPQPKAAPAKKAAGKAAKKAVSDDDDDVEMDTEPAVAKRTEAPRRAARAAPKKYIDISDDDGDDGGQDETFEISD
ncbi:DNA topoisomerase II [Fomitiporia mediterranea MF3/22]|uniref:DNA topoisomerase II n=1 Tax=Fomitiporia mediterranea (strain MF3/22) TaxID=694068 RepID=UPI00044098FD|nr:DNA topoisomerase II [Fomitiporia mediterranea MF3/22]EJD04491.1 DNA topoisomerase II [Fomitiporia mediterranea MF3/22]